MFGLGSSSVLGIGLRVYLVNQFSQQAQAVSQSMNNMGLQANKLRDSFEEMALASAGLTAAGYGLTRAWGGIFGTGMKFEHTMVAVGAVSGATNIQLKELSDTAKELSRTFPYTAQQIAEGMERIAKGGIDADALPELTKTFLAAATAAREEFSGDTGVAEMLTDVMQAWGLKPEEASRMGDMMTKAALESTTSFRQIYESYTYSQDTFRNLNVSMEESLALIALIGNQGIKASRAGIALQNMYKELSIAITGSDRANKKGKAFAMMGIDPEDFVDAQGDVHGVLELFSRMKEGIRGLTSIQRERVLQDIFGTRGKRGATPLTRYLDGGEAGSVTKSLRELVSEISNSEGAMKGINDQLMNTPQGQWQLLQNSWQEFKITLYEGIPLVIEFLGVLKDIMKGLIWFAKTPIGRVIALMTLLAGPVMILVGAFGMLTSAMGLLFTASKWRTFGVAARWAWLQASAGIAKYLGLLGGTTKAAGAKGGIQALFGQLDKGGNLMNSAGKRLMVAPTMDKFGFIGRILGQLSPALTRFLVPVAGLIRLATPIGLISGAMSALGVSIKTQFLFVVNSLIMGLYQIVNVIETISDWITVLFGGKASGTFASRNSAMHDKLWGIVRKSHESTPLAPGSGAFSPAQQKSHDNQMKYINRNSGNTTSQTIVNIIQDGKVALSKVIDNNAENTLNAQYGYS